MGQISMIDQMFGPTSTWAAFFPFLTKNSVTHSLENFPFDWCSFRFVSDLDLDFDLAAPFTGLLYNMGHGMQAVPVVTSPDGEVP